MIIALAVQNVIVVVIVALAVLLIVRQFYRLLTGKTTKCSCCPGCGPGDEAQPSATRDDDQTTPPCE